MRVFFTKDGHKHIRPGDLLLTITSGLYVHNRTLNNALESQRRLRIDFISARYLRRIVFDKVGQRLAQIINISRTGAQYIGSTGVVEQRQQQVFHGNELVTLLSGFNKSHMEANFKFLGNHGGFLGMYQTRVVQTRECYAALLRQLYY
jgi:hypothetical protein